MDSNSNKQFEDWFRDVKNLASKERKQNEDHDGFKVRWKKIKPPQEKKGIFDIIFTYIYPITPFIKWLESFLERIGIKGGVQVFISLVFCFAPFFLGFMIYFVESGPKSFWTNPLGGIIIILSSIFVENNIAFTRLMFWLILITIYVLGYYQLFFKNKNK